MHDPIVDVVLLKSIVAASPICATGVSECAADMSLCVAGPNVAATPHLLNAGTMGAFVNHTAISSYFSATATDHQQSHLAGQGASLF